MVPKLAIVQKAFVVWHNGMLNVDPHEGYTIDSLPVTYADTHGKAKQAAYYPYEYYLDGEPVKYIDLKVRRVKKCDKVMFEGYPMTKMDVEKTIKERTRISERKFKVEQYPDDSKFYIQKGYCGNCILFWGLGNCGYTSNITEAQIYTKEEVLNRFVPGSAENRIWESSHVLANLKPVVDSQYLNPNFVS